MSPAPWGEFYWLVDNMIEEMWHLMYSAEHDVAPPQQRDRQNHEIVCKSVNGEILRTTFIAWNVEDRRNDPYDQEVLERVVDYILFEDQRGPIPLEVISHQISDLNENKRERVLEAYSRHHISKLRETRPRPRMFAPR